MPGPRTSTDPRPARGSARTALLDAAHRLVRERGWTAASVEELCSAAGVTKGAFFHHFASKEELGVAAAHHWSAVTGALFANAPYHRHADPLERILGYVDFRAALANGPMAAISCFAGTTVQEMFGTSEPIRAACGASITDHAGLLVEDFAAAIAHHPPRLPVSAESLALYTQTALQGGFVLAKAANDHTPLLDAITHLKNYLTLLLKEPMP